MSTWSNLLTLLWELGEAPRPIAAASKQQGRKGTIFVANCLHRLLLEMWAWDKGLLRDDASLSHWFCCQMSCEFRTDFWASCKPWQISANYVLRDTLCFLCSAGLWQLMQIMWEPNGLQPWILRPPCPPHLPGPNQIINATYVQLAWCTKKWHQLWLASVANVFLKPPPDWRHWSPSVNAQQIGGYHNVQQGLEGPNQLGCVPVGNWVIAHMEWPVMSGISPSDDGLTTYSGMCIQEGSPQAMMLNDAVHSSQIFPNSPLWRAWWDSLASWLDDMVWLQNPQRKGVSLKSSVELSGWIWTFRWPFLRQPQHKKWLSCMQTSTFYHSQLLQPWVWAGDGLNPI